MAVLHLDARHLVEAPSGTDRHARELVPELVRQAPEHRFVVLLPPGAPPIAAPGADQIVARPRGDGLANHLFGRVALARAARRFGPPDVHHALFHVLPRGLPPSLRVVVTVHDLVWVDHPRGTQRSAMGDRYVELLGRAALPHAVRRANRIVCVSGATADRVRRLAPGVRPTVIHHGVSASFRREIDGGSDVVGPALGGEAPYVAALGSHKRYKNLAVLIRAFARASARRPDAGLVLWGDTARLEPAIQSCGASTRIVRLGRLDDEAAIRILAGARLFVLPSSVEGVGLPLVEAMALGTPTAVSAVEPMVSLAGGAAALFDPHRADELEAVIVRALDSQPWRERLSAAGRRRSLEFTWKRAASRTLDLYESLLGGR